MNEIDRENITKLIIYPDSLDELNSLNKYTRLEILDCNSLNLTELPPLPTTLTQLYCFNNGLKKLPESLSGTSLTELWCSDNELTELPNLPASLTKLWCFSNILKKLPDLSDTSLTELRCQNNHLEVLLNLPRTLTNLTCSGNELKKLPPLPASLRVLNCSHIKLTYLEELPLNLTELNCSDNLLAALPNLHASLRVLNCSRNILPELPNLPASLTTLLCFVNRLNSLPSPLPTLLTTLECSTNELTSLPQLPISLTRFRCDNIIGFVLPENIREYNQEVQNVLRQMTNTPIVDEDEADPYEIHKYTKQINLKSLRDELNQPEGEVDAHYFESTIKELIDKNFPEKEEKKDYTDDLELIMENRIRNYKFKNLSPELNETIHSVLEYIKKQPNEIQKQYIESLLYESCNAYNNGSAEEKLSCVKGILERTITTLGDVLAIVLSDRENEKYEKIVAIIRFEPEKLLKKYVQDWFKINNYEKTDAILRKYEIDKAKNKEEKEEIRENIKMI